MVSPRYAFRSGFLFGTTGAFQLVGYFTSLQRKLIKRVAAAPLAKLLVPTEESVSLAEYLLTGSECNPLELVKVSKPAGVSASCEGATLL